MLVLVGSVRANPCDTCSGCYDLAISYCMGGTTAAACVGSLGAYKWCGPNPCDSCSGCYRPDGTCETGIANQATCMGGGIGYHGTMWCGGGADAGTCIGCYGCYKHSDTAGPVCDTNSFIDESACTAYNHIDGVDNTWCPSTASQSFPCVSCNGCYDLKQGYCYSSDHHMNCYGAHKIWCGPDPCEACTGCYDTSGFCDTAVLNQAACITVGGARWCGADEGTCTGCSSCYLKSDTAGVVCDPTFDSEGSACTAYSDSVDGIDNTLCESTLSPTPSSGGASTCWAATSC